VVVEKPFGHDLESARELNDILAEVFPSGSIFRIDHYLGKETVQNILALRFANELYEPIWNRNCVKCHDYGKPGGKAVNLAPDLGIVFNTSYMSLRAKIALRWYPDEPGQPKELLKPVDDGPPDVLPAYAWGSHRSRLVDMLDAGHRGVQLTAQERARLIEWIDLNMPYYPTYETDFPDNPYGRSPLTFDQARKLVKVTCDRDAILPREEWKTRADATGRLGTGVNFMRPEMSPCLKGLPADRREQALAIIRAGAEQLRKHGRPDMNGTPDFKSK